MAALCIWDEKKREINLAKHGIDFAAVPALFDDPNIVVQADDRYPYGGIRYRAIGWVHGDMLLIVYTWRGGVRRVISARRANRREKSTYAEKKASRA